MAGVEIRIEDSLQIADEGKKKRAEAEKELQNMEAELKATLTSAKARGDKAGFEAKYGALGA